MTNLIRQFGEFWNPDMVSWGKKGPGNGGKLIGEVKGDNGWVNINFWEARGVYVLYDNFTITYVGKAIDQPLGKRLRDHLSDRLAGRWDMFSWYSLSSIRWAQNDVRVPGTRQISPDTMINTLEALCIAIAEPRLNRRKEALPGALEATQVGSEHPQSVRHYLERILAKLEE